MAISFHLFLLKWRKTKNNKSALQFLPKNFSLSNFSLVDIKTHQKKKGRRRFLAFFKHLWVLWPSSSYMMSVVCVYRNPISYYHDFAAPFSSPPPNSLIVVTIFFFEFMGAPAQLLHSLSLHVASAIFSL